MIKSEQLPRRSDHEARLSRIVWWAAYLLLLVGGLIIASFARMRAGELFLGLSLGVLMIVVIGWMIRPRATLYVTIFFTTISDIVTVSWFPFVKNLSSRESIAYVADGLTVSPLEISLYIGFAISVLRRYAATKRPLAPTLLNRPILVFTAFVVWGFVRGITSGGDVRIAVLVGRAFFYVLLVFAIMVNECTEEHHRRLALWAVIAGVVFQALLSIEFLWRLSPSRRSALESLNEHGSSIGQNVVIVTLIAAFVFWPRRSVLPFVLLFSAVPVSYAYLVAQRRAAIAALVVALLMMAIALFWRKRRAFWAVVPFVSLILIIYLAAFWNSTSSIAFPAQAIKPIIAPGSASAEDVQSDLYRLVEAFDLNATIRANPLLGHGFGKQFYRPIPLPNIDFFALNAYLPHNSVLWVWTKLGFGGFVATLYLIGKAIMLGADRVRRATSGVDLIVALSAVTFVAMYTVYTYVDVSWDSRNTVILGVACAICAAPISPPASDSDKADQDAGSSATTLAKNAA